MYDLTMPAGQQSEQGWPVILCLGAHKAVIKVSPDRGLAGQGPPPGSWTEAAGRIIASQLWPEGPGFLLTSD